MKIPDYISRNSFVFALILLAIYQIALAFQGFDVCDEGWCLSFYQQFFNHPQSNEYQFAYYIAGLFGGTLYSLFPQGGILYFRLLNIGVILLCFTIVYHLFKQHLKNWQIILGVFIVVLNFDWGVIVLHHNNITTLITLGAASLLIGGLSKSSPYLLALSGVLFAINIFARLPNVTLLILSLLIPLNAFYNKYTIKKTILQLIVFFCGVTAGLILVGGIIASLGHLDIMKDSIYGLLNKGAGDESNHNFTLLAKSYIGNYINIASRLIHIGLILITTLIILKITGRNLIMRIAGVIISSLISLFILNKYADVFLLYAVGYSGLAIMFFSKSFDKNIKLYVVAAALVMAFQPLGSDAGIGNFGANCLWLALPLAMCSLSLINNINGSITIKDKIHNISIGRCNIVIALTIIVASFIILKLFMVSHNAYFDEGSRLEKRCSIDAPLANGILTTEKRAEIINNLLPELKKFVSPGDFLLAYDNIPMINFLTQTRPYLGTSWVWVYDSGSLKRSIEKSESRNSKLPVVLVQKFTSIGNDFSQLIPDYLSETRENDYLWKVGRTKAMNSFLQRNNYTIVWSNDYFNILIPNLF